MSSRRKEHRRTAADKKENHGKPDDSESQPLLVSPTTNAGGGRGSSTQQQQQQQHGLRAHPSQQQQHNRRTSSGAFLSAAASTPSALSPVRPLFGASSSSSIGGPMSAPYNIQQYAANSSNSNNSNTSSLSMLENTELDAAAALAFSLKPVSGFPPTSNISTTTPSKNSNNLNSSGAGGGDIGAIGLSTSSTSLTDQAGEGKFGSGQNRMHRYHRPSTATSDPTGLISSSSATSSSVILLDSSSSPVAATIADSVNLTPAPKTPPVLLDQRQHFLAMGTGNQPRMYVEDSSGNELDDDDDTNSTTSKRGSFTRTRSGMRSGGVEGGDGSGSIFKGYVDFEAISDYLVTHSNVQQLAATAAAAAATGTGFSGLPHRRVNSLNTEDSTTAPSIRGSTKRNSSNLLLNNYGSGIGGMGIGGGGPISSSRVLFYSDQTGVIGAKKFESLNFYSHYYASSHYTQGSGGSAPLSPTTSELSSSNAATNNSDSASYSYSVFLTHILQSAPFWIDVTNPSSSEMNVFRKVQENERKCFSPLPTIPPPPSLPPVSFFSSLEFIR